MHKRETIDITTESAYRRHSGWSFGLALIGLGCLFLLRNYGYPMPENWWAFFLLIPALPNLARAISIARRNPKEALRPLGRAFFFTFFAAAFLLDWDWAQIWPLLLIAGGASMILNARDRVA